VRFVGEIM